MQMFYCTRFEHNPDKPTEYYLGGGKWAPMKHKRLAIRLYANEDLAKEVIKDLTECDWHSVDIQT